MNRSRREHINTTYIPLARTPSSDAKLTASEAGKPYLFQGGVSVLLISLCYNYIYFYFYIQLKFKKSCGRLSFSSIQSLSHVRLCDPMNHSTPGLPVHHQLPEFTHTHVHLVGDAIQPSHPLLSPSPPVPNPSQHQGLFQ